MSNFLFTSESVAVGHPDKIADQISDAVLDACLREDPMARVACETLVSAGFVILAGEITTKAKPDYQKIVRDTIRDIGYDDGIFGFDFRSCGVITSITEQSPDIAQGITVGERSLSEQGAGDQGLMFGYACDETPELMPLPIITAHHIVRELLRARKEREIPYLCPDGKTQITVEYDADKRPLRIHTVVLSTQHTADVENERISKDMQTLVRRVVPTGLIDRRTQFFINPTGRFVVGGPTADCGLTGRKIIVDTYGGMGRHGGGAFSGKDPTKVDRAGAYAARYVAKNIVAAGLASRCEIQISYAIGIAHPISIKVDTFSTSEYPEDKIAEEIPKIFDLSPGGIIKMLDLRRPIYTKTAFGGHFGREEFPWEKTDRTEALIQGLGSSSKTG